MDLSQIKIFNSIISFLWMDDCLITITEITMYHSGKVLESKKP